MSFVFALFLNLVSSPVVEPAQDEAYAAALELYDEGRFAEAAARFEALAEANGPSIRRFEAGQMRLAAGHMAHALRDFEMYLAGALSRDDRELGESRLARRPRGSNSWRGV